MSSGAIAAGLAPLGLRSRPRDLATQQAAASVGQGLLVHRYTEAFAGTASRVGQVLLTADDVTRRAHYRNAHRTLRQAARARRAARRQRERHGRHRPRSGSATTTGWPRWSPTWSTPTRWSCSPTSTASTTATRDAPARALIAEVPRRRRPRRRRIGRAGGAGVGTGGMVTKVEAARIATGAGIPVVLTSAEHAAAALAGDPVGTLFHATGRRRPTRLLWLAHATEPQGAVLLDAGAVRAVVERRASLLAAGITGVKGGSSPATRSTSGPDGIAVARGLVNFDATELPGLLGRSTHELARELGPAYEREVVHRDDLVLL